MRYFFKKKKKSKKSKNRVFSRPSDTAFNSCPYRKYHSLASCCLLQGLWECCRGTPCYSRHSHTALLLLFCRLSCAAICYMVECTGKRQ